MTTGSGCWRCSASGWWAAVAEAVRRAVILAAWRGTRLGAMGQEHPKGFIRLGDRPIMEESLLRLQRAGVEQVVVVTGHLEQWYEDLARRHAGWVETVHNPRYADSGSMYSLSLAAARVGGEDFLLLESDLIYAQRALQVVQDYPRDNVVLLSDATGAGDEVYVQCSADADAAPRLQAMSKERTALASVYGELVGISRISHDLFQAMLRWSRQAFETSLHVDYETDALVAVAAEQAVYCQREDGLAWSEIDDAAHLHRAQTLIYPAIKEELR